MLSHVIKKLLDEATGLKFSPIIGMSEQVPIASYRLIDVDNEVISQSALEVRLWGYDFDELEELREKIKDKLCAKTKDGAISIDGYLLRCKLTGGTILPEEGDPVSFESTQFIVVKWLKKGK